MEESTPKAQDVFEQIRQTVRSFLVQHEYQSALPILWDFVERAEIIVQESHRPVGIELRFRLEMERRKSLKLQQQLELMRYYEDDWFST